MGIYVQRNPADEGGRRHVEKDRKRAPATAVLPGGCTRLVTSPTQPRWPGSATRPGGGAVRTAAGQGPSMPTVACGAGRKISRARTRCGAGASSARTGAGGRVADGLAVSTSRRCCAERVCAPAASGGFAGPGWAGWASSPPGSRRAPAFPSNRPTGGGAAGDRPDRRCAPICGAGANRRTVWPQRSPVSTGRPIRWPGSRCARSAPGSDSRRSRPEPARRKTPATANGCAPRLRPGGQHRRA